MGRGFPTGPEDARIRAARISGLGKSAGAVSWIPGVKTYQFFWHANRTSLSIRCLGVYAMMTARKTPPPATQSDIVEAELLGILQTMIDANCGLSAIHQLLDEAKTMAEIRARFAQWRAEHHDSRK